MVYLSIISHAPWISFGVVGTIILNYKTFLKTPITICVILFVIYLMYCWYKLLRNLDKSIIQEILERSLKIFTPFLILSFMPVAWYAFAVHHSSIHFWFTNKACVVSLLSILFGLVQVIEYRKGRLSV